MDKLIMQFDRALRTIFAPAASVRLTPGSALPEASLDETQRAEAAALMRVNHCGEICAQALYQGQAMTCKDEGVKKELDQASREETEHLAWTEQRITELGGRTSLLNPLWYAGSLAIGMMAGKLGDRWNLGFLAETERQVEAHLTSHLDRLPSEDGRSRAILEQMRDDEVRHAETALQLGGQDLPGPVKAGMKLASKVMTSVSYRL